MYLLTLVVLALVAVLLGAWLMDRRRTPESRGGTPDPRAEHVRAEAQRQANIHRTAGPGGPGAT